jgi:hypothetical protein
VALFPHDDRAKRLKQQSYLLSEFLDDEHCKALDLPRTGEGKKALIQIHCHEHAVLEPEVEERVLRRVGLEAGAMPTGCCGMAGSFGFEADKIRSRHGTELMYDVKVDQANPLFAQMLLDAATPLGASSNDATDRRAAAQRHDRSPTQEQRRCAEEDCCLDNCRHHCDKQGELQPDD